MSNFNSVKEVATYLRDELKSKKYLLIFAYNGTGKTRISMAFKDLGKTKERSQLVTKDGFKLVTNSGDSLNVTQTKADTLYFNAFTEDLFSWDNDLEGDNKRILKINSESRFFAGLEELEMESRIRRFLHRYVDFDFSIDYKSWNIVFSRDVSQSKETVIHIKVSRGEENLFIWCFFLAIVELAMDSEIEAYSWVKYIYIDDPISSLDENNAIAVGHHLAQLLKDNKSSLKIVISSHHALFFNVLCNEFKNQFTNKNKSANKYFLSSSKEANNYSLTNTNDTPFFYHVAMLVELEKAASSGNLYTYHFSILRSILEKTASFHGHDNFATCIRKDKDDEDGILHKRLIDIMNHGNYSHFEPIKMVQQNKEYFEKILRNFLQDYNFNTSLVSKLLETQQETQQEIQQETK